MATTAHEHPWMHPLGYLDGAPYDAYPDQDEYELDGMKLLEDREITGQDVKDLGDFPSDDRSSASFGEWSPRILKLKSLVIFVGFLLVLISLAEIFVSRSPYPAPTSSALTFVWTYIPPAAVVIVDWIWQSYDLEIKLLLPWALLSHDTSRREQAWTLDYRTMFYPTAMWHAARHKHFVVLLTSAGFWVVAVASVMSTSLWTIDSVSSTQNVSLAITSAMPPSSEITVASLWDNETYTDVLVAHGVFNLSLPRWIVNNSIVLEPFEPSDVSSLTPGAPLVVQTKAYSATLDCTEADVSYILNATTDNLILNVDAGGCNAMYLIFSEIYLYTFDPAYETYYFGIVLEHTCPGTTNVTTILSSANATTIQNASIPVIEIGFSTSVACVPQYQQATVVATVSSLSSSPLDASSLSGSQRPFSLPGGDTFIQAFNNNTPSVVEAYWSQCQECSAGFPGPYLFWSSWFQLLQVLNNVSFDALLDQDTLVNTSQVAFEQLWATYALYNLFTTPAENHTTVSGFSDAVNRMLQARPISVRVLQAMLALLALDAILIYVLRPRTILPLNPSSLTAMAIILERSDSNVHAALHRTGNLNGRRFQEEMQKWHFTVTTDNGFMIRAINTHESADRMRRYSKDLNDGLEEVPGSRTPRMWRPVVLHPISQILLLSLLALTIATLEALYRLSLAHEGFVAVPSGPEWLWWSYAAPAYVSILGVLTAWYDFHARAVQPYVAMSREPQPVEKSLGYNPAAHTGLSLFWHSLRFRNLIGTTTSISLLIIPFMKIAVAGLLVTSSEMITETIKLAPMTTFNTTINGTDFSLIGDSGVFLQTSQTWPLTEISEFGLPLPAWTTSTEAIGEVDLSTVTFGSQQNATVTVPLPIFSSLLVNCTALDPDEYEFTTVSGGPALFWFKDSSKSVNNSCTTGLGLGFEMTYFGQVSGAAAGPGCAGVYFIIYAFTDVSLQNVTNATVVTCENNMTISNRTVALGLSGSNHSGPVIMSLGDPTDVVAVDITDVTAIFDIGFGYIVSSTPYLETTWYSFDIFFQTWILQNASEPLWNLGDPDKLMSVIPELFASLWAFWGNSIMRTPVDPSVDALDALIHTQQSRICQDWVATRVMQALLGAIFLCDVISAIVLRHSGRALPKAPYSIGTQMSLLVDSPLLDLVSQNKQGGDMIVVVNRSLEAHRFSLGWSRDNSRFGIELEDAAA